MNVSISLILIYLCGCIVFSTGSPHSKKNDRPKVSEPYQLKPKSPKNLEEQGAKTTEDDSKKYFRLFIKLLEPYKDELENPKSDIFREYKRILGTSIGEALQAPDFVTANLIYVINSANISHCKVIIDVEVVGKFNQAVIERMLVNHLNTNGFLGSLKASSKDLNIRDYGEDLPVVCLYFQLPCEYTDACYSRDVRCDGIQNCPRSDSSDERDCPMEINEDDESSSKEYEISTEKRDSATRHSETCKKEECIEESDTREVNSSLPPFTMSVTRSPVPSTERAIGTSVTLGTVDQTGENEIRIENERFNQTSIAIPSSSSKPSYRRIFLQPQSTTITKPLILSTGSFPVTENLQLSENTTHATSSNSLPVTDAPLYRLSVPVKWVKPLKEIVSVMEKLDQYKNVEIQIFIGAKGKPSSFSNITVDRNEP